jgi:hypothetical protein
MRSGRIVSDVRPSELSLENLFAACMKEEV